MQLTREVRLFLGPVDSTGTVRTTNSWSGGPNLDPLSPRIQLRLTIRGQPDARSGIVADIRRLDQAAPLAVQDLLASRPGAPGVYYAPQAWLVRLWPEVAQRLAPAIELEILEVAVSPQQSYRMYREDPQVLFVTRQYEFSAAHRLHAPQLTDAENSELFGKCNRPHGHGHNYVMDVCWSGPVDEAKGTILSDATLDGIVREAVLDRLDHRFLNIEVPEFQEQNPTVENMARVIWGWLEGRLEPATLERIRLYETPKTWADVSRSER